MISYKVKEEKGITMIVLVVTVIILLIVTGTLIGNAYTSIQLSRLNKLESDIEMLNDRIAAYYVENNELPLYGSEVDTSKITGKSRKRWGRVLYNRYKFA